MNNQEIVEIFKKECLPQAASAIFTSLVKIKDADFKKRIEQTLSYLDCEAYDDNIRKGFRIFAREMINQIEE